MAGYSKTPLAKKLGIRASFSVKLVNVPEYYWELFADLPDDIRVNDNAIKLHDFVHFFTKDEKELTRVLPKLKKEIVQDGMIWVSWPKKSARLLAGQAKMVCDITEQDVRDTALKIGLVDIKVCAVDEVWSGLKLVIPVTDRK